MNGHLPLWERRLIFLVWYTTVTVGLLIVMAAVADVVDFYTRDSDFSGPEIVVGVGLTGVFAFLLWLLARFLYGKVGLPFRGRFWGVLGAFAGYFWVVCGVYGCVWLLPFEGGHTVGDYVFNCGFFGGLAGVTLVQARCVMKG